MRTFSSPWLLLALSCASPAFAAELKVLSIGDGDTIRVSSFSGANKTTVRLACIDAPETSQAPYGNDARQALQADLPIETEVGLRTKATDRYGRTVAEILKGTTNINQALVAKGAAFVYWRQGRRSTGVSTGLNLGPKQVQRFP